MEPSDRFLLLSFLFYGLAALFTIVETFLWPLLLNIMEHLCIAIHGVLFTAWIWLTLKPKAQARG